MAVVAVVIAGRGERLRCWSICFARTRPPTKAQKNSAAAAAAAEMDQLTPQRRVTHSDFGSNFSSSWADKVPPAAVVSAKMKTFCASATIFILLRFYSLSQFRLYYDLRRNLSK